MALLTITYRVTDDNGHSWTCQEDKLDAANPGIAIELAERYQGQALKPCEGCRGNPMAPGCRCIRSLTGGILSHFPANRRRYA